MIYSKKKRERKKNSGNYKLLKKEIKSKMNNLEMNIQENNLDLISDIDLLKVH